MRREVKKGSKRKALNSQSLRKEMFTVLKWSWGGSCQAGADLPFSGMDDDVGTIAKWNAEQHPRNGRKTLPPLL